MTNNSGVGGGGGPFILLLQHHKSFDCFGGGGGRAGNTQGGYPGAGSAFVINSVHSSNGNTSEVMEMVR